MRIISLWEPWGTAIALGLKKIETRGWSTNYRGMIAIHCAQTRQHAGFILHPDARQYFAGAGIIHPAQLNFGKVVAVANLDDCQPTQGLLSAGRVSPQEHVFGDYGVDRFGWLLKDVRKLARPFPLKGRQGFFQVDDRLIEEAL